VAVKCSRGSNRGISRLLPLLMTNGPAGRESPRAHGHKVPAGTAIPLPISRSTPAARDQDDARGLLGVDSGSRVKIRRQSPPGR